MMLRAPTRTKISLDLNSSELSARYAKLPCDGVALTSAESLVRALGVHPRKLLANREEEKYLDLFSRDIVRAARDFAPRPVVYQTLDLHREDYAALEGGAEYEKSTMPGLRGCTRYLADEASFRLDLRAAKRARDMGCVNVDVMLPMVERSDELARCREIVIEEGLFASAEFELWMMPAARASDLKIEEFIPLISGVALAPDSMAQLEPGANGGAGRPMALDAMTRIARVCAESGVACSLCGNPGDPHQAPHVETLRALIEAGLTGWTVAPESYDAAVETITEAEESLGISPEREVAR